MIKLTLVDVPHEEMALWVRVSSIDSIRAALFWDMPNRENVPCSHIVCAGVGHMVRETPDEVRTLMKYPA